MLQTYLRNLRLWSESQVSKRLKAIVASQTGFCFRFDTKHTLKTQWETLDEKIECGCKHDESHEFATHTRARHSGNYAIQPPRSSNKTTVTHVSAHEKDDIWKAWERDLRNLRRWSESQVSKRLKAMLASQTGFCFRIDTKHTLETQWETFDENIEYMVFEQDAENPYTTYVWICMLSGVSFFRIREQTSNGHNNCSTYVP